METVHVPDVQHVAPVHPDPPHWAYNAAQVGLVPPPPPLPPPLLADSEAEYPVVVKTALVPVKGSVPALMEYRHWEEGYPWDEVRYLMKSFKSPL